MRKFAFLLIFSNIVFGDISARALPAQDSINNGSFLTGDFSGWTVLGGASVDTGNAPSIGTYDALIQSTGDDPDENTDSVPTTTIAAAFNLSDLPPTSGLASGGNIVAQPVNGQTIYQTFSLTATEVLSFSTSYFTTDFNPYDSAGYLLETGSEPGVYTELYNTFPYGSAPSTPTPYETTSLTLGPGTYMLGFVAYNTDNYEYSTSLYVTDIEVPEPGTWLLVGIGLGLFVIVRRSHLSLR